VGKVILARGCDPVMAARSASFLPPLLGGATILATSTDDEFMALLETRKQDIAVVFFAPGAHRWSDAKLPIPGGNADTLGWGIAEYHTAVRQRLGDAVPIVGSAREDEIVPLLRSALGLQ